MFNKKGITLIALVVTIIVLLILAAVTIALILGPDGMVSKARESKLATRYASIMDEAYLRQANMELKKRAGVSIEGDEEFINRLLAQGLIKLDEDEIDMDTYTLYVGKLIYPDSQYVVHGSTLMGIGNDQELLNADLPGNEHMKNLTLIIRTSEVNELAELPLTNATGLTINWDATNPLSTFKTPNKSINPTHTYTKIGEYEVQIKGDAAENAAFGRNEHSSEAFIDEMNLVGIKYWGENGFYEFNFSSSNLEGEIAMPSVNSFINARQFKGTFALCHRLTGVIPNNLFKNCPNVTNFDNTFMYTPFPIIPENLFAHCPNVKSFSGTFAWSSFKGPIPENLFANNPEVLSFSSLFDECGLIQGSIPENLFANNPKVTSFQGTFNWCSSLTGPIPENLFANNTKAKNFDSTFYWCHKISGTIPENLFANNIDAENFNSTFYGCYELTGTIPGNLFANNPKIETVNDTFIDCTKITGISEDLFSNMPNVGNIEIIHSTFSGCTALTTIPENLFASLSNVKEMYRLFENCTNITSIPSNLFANNTQLTDIYGIFTGCEQITSIPPNLFANNTNVLSFTETFSYCKNLTSIPENLFINNTKVTSFYGTFSSCTGLTNIPSNLFANNTNASQFSYAFSRCTSLTGLAPALWEKSFVKGTSCFYNCTNLSNYNDIPSNWK